VDFVELVAGAELSADGVPQQLHQLDPVLGIDAATAADVAVEVGAQFGNLEVVGVGVQVYQAARDDGLDDVLDRRIRDLRDGAVRGGKARVGLDHAVPRDVALGHCVGEPPHRVAPGDDFAEARLDAVEAGGAGDVERLGEGAADEVELDGETGAAVQGGAAVEAGI